MNLRESFISGDPVFELPGLGVMLDTYMLCPTDPDKDRIFDNQAYGACYLKELINSEWGPIWARHIIWFEPQRNLTHLGEVDSWQVFKYPNHLKVSVIRDDGNQFEFQLDNLKKNQQGYSYVIRQEYNLIFDAHKDLIASIQHGLKNEGHFPVYEIFERLQLTQHLWHPDFLENTKLVFDEELYTYWNPEAVSTMLEYEMFVPEFLVDYVRSKL